MFDAVLARKAQAVERAVARARQELNAAQGHFATDFSRQDAAILNLQRACEACLDMAQRVISIKQWGLAHSSKDLYGILLREGIISTQMAASLTRMVGFRNIAVHDYQAIDLAIVQSVIENQTQDLLDFSQQMLQQFFQQKEVNE